MRTTAKAFAKNVFINQERKSEVRRRSDTVVVLTINDANWRSAGVDLMTSRAASGKPKFLGSGGSMETHGKRVSLALEVELWDRQTPEG